mmetsp:Transcript_2179/g.8603  ORF Transcript_2179/g.8603 Transcript_2179/m.8603 type:complete len:247 (+) Transcript_2179:385-1125(+)
MGIEACARCTRIWCVRPVRGRARTNAATKRRLVSLSSDVDSRFAGNPPLVRSSSPPRFRAARSASNPVVESTAQTVTACFGNDASMSGWPPTLACGSGGGGGCTHRASGMEPCAPTCAFTVNVPFCAFDAFSPGGVPDASPAASSPLSPSPSKRTTAPPSPAPRGTRPTQSARYSLPALPNGAHSCSPRNCRANPSTNAGSFTKRHTPLVSMSNRCTMRGASKSLSEEILSSPLPARSSFVETSTL